MTVTDKIKRYGIGGFGYPAGPVNLRKPLSGSIPAELSRLSGGYALADRWEVTTGGGLSAGDYIFRVGPYSERGFKSTHRALGDISVFLQVGGVANPLAPVSCLGRKRPPDSGKGISLGPFTAAAGDRMWLVAERKDFSTLKYQVELDFTAAVAPSGGSYFMARIQDQTLVTYDQINPYYPYGYNPDGTFAVSTAIGPNDEMYVGGTYQNEAMLALPLTEPDRTPWVLRLASDGEVAWKVHLESLGPVLPPGYTITSLRPAYGQEVEAIAVDPISGDVFALFAGVCNYTSPTEEEFVKFTAIIRISSAGSILAQKLITTARFDAFPYFEGNQVCCDTSGNVYVLGRFNDTALGAGTDYPIILKFNNSLSLTWKRAIADNPLGANDLAVTPEGIVYFVGQETSVGSPVRTILMKFDVDGTLLWQKFIDKVGIEPTRQRLPDISVHPDGGVVLYERILVGTEGVNIFDVIALLRIDANGSILWQKRSVIVGESQYGTSTALTKRGMTVGSDGTIYATSVRGDTPAQQLLCAYSGNGSFLFSNAYGADDGWNGDESMFQLPSGFGGIGSWDSNISAGSDRVIWNMCMFQAGYLTPPIGAPYRFYQPGVFVLPNDAAIPAGLYDMNYTPVNPGTGAYLNVTESNTNYFTTSDGNYVLGSSNSAYTVYTPAQAVTCETSAIYVTATLARPFETSALTYFPGDLLTVEPLGGIGWLSVASTSGWSTHIDTNYRANHVQTIYKASEVLASGLTAGSVLNGLKWYVLQPVPPYGSILGFKVRIFHTASTSAITSTPAVPVGAESKLTVYSDGPLVEFTAAEVAGELTVNFSSNFTWNGTSNICIETCMAQNQDDYTPEQPRLRCTYPVGENGTLWDGSDVEGDGCALVPAMALPPRASIRFTLAP